MRSHTTIAIAIAAFVIGGCASTDDPADAGNDGTVRTTTSTIGSPAASSTSDLPTTTTDASTATTTIAASTTTDEVGAPADIDPTSPPARLDVDPGADPDADPGLDAGTFAQQLSEAHGTMTDPTAGAAARERAGLEYQLTLRELADRPELDEAVLAASTPDASPALERTVRARQFLQARSTDRPPRPLPDVLPAWTVVEPEPIDTLLAHYAEAEQLTGVAWYWLAAIHLQETRMGRIEGVSSAGAVGPMQFLPTTWEACCIGDPTVTRDAVVGAATYLSQSGAPDDMAAALYQYNPNDGYVAVVTAYAESLREQPELYAGYHAFQVFFGTSAGTVRLPIGYTRPEPIDAAAYLAAHPQDAA